MELRDTSPALRESERVSLALRALYAGYGYGVYKMSRFEEYELYARNKAFLASDRMIVFTDPSGRLMALKPDVTVSILKELTPEPGTVRKACYTESVYRADAKADSFREISQTGLECIGAIDRYQICEVVLLAAESLARMGSDFVLDVSHLGLVSGALEAAGVPEELKGTVLGLIRDKNLADLGQLCREKGLDGALLAELVTACGRMEDVLSQLVPLCRNDAMRGALEELESVCAALEASGYAESIRLDFSAVNDLRYYDGVIFRGYLRGLPAAVLSGGQYDSLARKMGKPWGAVGFAVYLDELELLTPPPEYDADVLLLYDADADASEVAAAVRAVSASGKTVSAQRTAPEKLRYRQILRPEDWRKANA
jgi:ATP phosphoribosyltransferase regulatory subunit